MDPTTTFCPHQHCPARGQTGQGNIGIHSQKDQRFICHACHQTFSARKGTVFYRLRTSAEGSDIHVMLVKRFCATVGQHRLPIQQRSTENRGHPRGVSTVSVTPV